MPARSGAVSLPRPRTAAQRWRVIGRVQGVGFRPFVYRLAHDLGLAGWVRNVGGEVEIHVQGPVERLREFGEALLTRTPPAAAARLSDVRPVRAEPTDDFRILESAAGEQPQVHVPPDLFTCDDCLAELRDPAARRYRYPFINCQHSADRAIR